MAKSIFDVEALQGNREHLRAQQFFRDELRGSDHPEALRALRKVTALLRIVTGALWDGSQGLDLGRQEQARIDATVMADLGTAIEDHCKEHGS